MGELDLHSLLAQYAAAAATHGQATESGDYEKANAAYGELEASYRELSRRGPEARRALLDLMDDSDLGVRCWAASHSLEVDAARAERVLEVLGESNSWIGLNARTTLQQWRHGKLGA